MDQKKIIINTIPHTPGVYIFSDDTQQIIYVGKAIDLYRRVSQYFQKSSSLDIKTRKLVSHISSFRYYKTVSEFDALLLEAKLIAKYQPKYNIITKDDKSSLYILISLSETIPHIQYIRKRQLDMLQIHPRDKIYGPFQSARVLKNLMRILRRIIPYCMQKSRSGVACFYSQIGLCTPCPSEIAGNQDVSQKLRLISMYRKNILRLSRILAGHSDAIEVELEKEMGECAKKNLFEQAAELRDHLLALKALKQKRFDPMVYVTGENQIQQTVQNELFSLQQVVLSFYPNVTFPHRIECIDISHLMGDQPVGALVVTTDGIPDARWYRRFRIKTVRGINDYGMIEEVIRRRFSHKEWPYPDILLIDGGKGQVTSVLSELSKMKIHNFPVIGLAKRMEEIIVSKNHEFQIVRLPLTNPALQLLIRIRNEAHRFAVRYHKHLRQKSMKDILHQLPQNATMNKI